MGEEVKWVRKATDIEMMFTRTCKDGNFVVVYRMSFCARRPVQPRLVEHALRLLYRKSPNLRVSVGERGGEMWFREMDSEAIPFEVSAADVEEVTDVLHDERYPAEGPLWQARLVAVPTPRYHPQHLSAFHHDLRHTFPHCYHLLFGFSHEIGDGHTFIRICAAFAHILDRVLSGEEVDEDQIGSFRLNEEYDSKAREYMARFDTDEEWRDECMGRARQTKSLLSHILSPCQDRPKRTVLLTRTLDQATTTQLREKCRAANVTLSSCVAAAGNLALVDMLEEKGLFQETYTISNMHLINMRRTWPKGTTEHAFGCYVTMSNVLHFKTPRTSNNDQFWQYAKAIHSKFYSLLKDDQFMQKAMFIVWCWNTDNVQYLSRDIDYNTRGDLTQKFEGTKEITVTSLLNSAAIHNSTLAWEHTFGTLRGRLSHTIKYNTSLLSEEAVRRCSDLVHGRLVKVAAP